jgi:hypothetical protein
VRKERLQLEKCSGSWKPVAHCSGEGWGFYGQSNSGLGGFFSLAMGSWAFLSELVWFVPLLGEGKKSWEHFAHQPCGWYTRLCISPLGCRNAGLWLLRMHEWYCCPWGMGYSLICLRSPDPTIRPSETSIQLLLGRGVMMTHLAALCWQWGGGGDRGEGTCF